MFNISEDSGLKSFVGRSYIVFGLPLRLGRTWPLSSMLTEAETNLHMTRGNLGRLAWRLLELVKAEASWKGRWRDGVTRVGKRGNNVNATVLMLILPPIRATSCIQFAPRCLGDGQHCPNFTSPCFSNPETPLHILQDSVCRRVSSLLSA